MSNTPIVIIMKNKLIIAIVCGVFTCVCCPKSVHAQVAPHSALPSYVSELINDNFIRQINIDLQDLSTQALGKKRSELKKMRTTLDRLLYLNASEVDKVNQFVLSSIEDTGPASVNDDSNILFFMNGVKKPHTESVLYIFVDGSCVGAGSSSKGFNCTCFYDDSDTSMHELVIIQGVQNNKRTRLTVYSSPALFSIKKKYVFEGILNKGIISELLVID